LAEYWAGPGVKRHPAILENPGIAWPGQENLAAHATKLGESWLQGITNDSGWSVPIEHRREFRGRPMG
jgi:hypothetical protein